MFTILYSIPSAPDDVKQIDQNCTSLNQVKDFYSSDQVRGLKMLFSNGRLIKTNINFQDNEFEYYRLIGHAYNSRKLDRVTVDNN